MSRIFSDVQQIPSAVVSIFYGKPADEGGYKTVAEKIKEELLILAVYDTV